jgi:AcrR family transcriptional regulator
MNGEAKKRRGRPREFDANVALAAATETFLRHGYAGASVDELGRSMQLSKPSLYAAFGDKRELYLAAVKARIRAFGERFRVAFEKGDSLEDSLRALFYEAVDAYLGDGMPPGCILISAGTTEAVSDAVIHDFARAFFESSDRILGEWIEKKLGGKSKATAFAIGKMVNGIQHDIALRARVGESRAKLRELAKGAATVLARAAAE